MRWPDGLQEEMQRDGIWDDEHGDRRNEIVCIGRGINHDAASALLEACLLTDEERQHREQPAASHELKRESILEQHPVAA